MKKFSFLHFMLAILVMASFAMISCTKEGPAGPAGKDGTDGEDGIDGQNGSATCIQCHDNSQQLEARITQWEASVHATGGNFARNEGECARCHTSQGFIGFINGTYDPYAAGAKIVNPNPQNCYTCHNIHSTYTSEDWTLTTSGPVTMFNTTATPDLGKGSLCANCHQGRLVDPFPVVGGADITVSSPRYGVHHGPQSNVFAGVGLFEVGTGLSNSMHTTLVTDACVTCHMSEAYGAQSGGHVMGMSYEYHGASVMNFKGCVSCHTDNTALVAEFEALQTEVAALLAELKLKLDATGITAAGSDNSVNGTYSPLVAGACLDYKAITEDKSLGVHNPTYVKQLLTNLINALP